MTQNVSLDDDLAMRVQGLVSAGVYNSIDDAVNALVRIALQGRGRGPVPTEPLHPPVRNPGDDRPININPGDVNWAGGP